MLMKIMNIQKENYLKLIIIQQKKIGKMNVKKINNKYKIEIKQMSEFKYIYFYVNTFNF